MMSSFPKLSVPGSVSLDCFICSIVYFSKLTFTLLYNLKHIFTQPSQLYIL